MKQKQISILAASLVAAFAANVASAGQIQSSSVSIAREVITDDAQVVISPSIAYRFAGDVDARVQAQTFQVQFKLQSGKFKTAPINGNSISVSDGISALIINQGAGAAINYTVDKTGLSTDKTTAWATITVQQSPTALIKQPLISFNVTFNTIGNAPNTAVDTDRATVNGLATVVGNIVTDFNTSGICVDNKQAKVEFFHYTALSTPLAIATALNATPDEHLRGGATNTATLITFPTNLLIKVAASTGDAKVSVAGANLLFAGTAAGPAFVNTTLINLGNVTITQNSTGYDSNLVNQYLMAPGVLALPTALNNIGRVEGKQLDVTVSAPNGFDVGASLYLSTTIGCAAAVGTSAVAVTALNAAGPITTTVNTAVLNATLGAAGTLPVYVCYGVNGVATPIPLTSFSAVATLVKAADAGDFLSEQNNVCKGDLYSLGGGVKIDVRNFISDKTPGGWMSVIRLINNSESRAIDIYGQMIYSDGSYGAYGLLTAGLTAGTTGGAVDKLGPRATLNLNSAQIATLLNKAPVHATAALNNAAGALTVVNSGAQRLRITSNAGTTLRVQNYITDGKTFLEASGQQGVDFEGSADRAPGSEGQYQDQDAFKGLNGK